MTYLPLQHFYIFPRQHRYGSEWELNFWDALYYLASHRGLPLRVTARTVCTLMNGGPPDAARFTTLRHHFMRYWQEAAEAGWLIECTPDHEKAAKANTGRLDFSFRGNRRVYCFLLPHYPPTQDYLLKPRGYVTRGWIRLVGGSYPKRLLNFLFGHPRLGAQADPQPCLAADLLQEFRQELRQTTGLSIHRGRLADAFEFLQQLGLVDCHQEQCRLNWEAFLSAPPLLDSNFATGELTYRADWLTAQAQDAARAQLALDILQQGDWPFRKFWRIYSDLAHLDQSQVAAIQRQLAAWRGQQGDAPGWTGLFQRASQPQPQRLAPRLVKSRPARLDCAAAADWHLPLPLAADVIEDVSVWHTQELAQARVVISLLPATSPAVKPGATPRRVTLSAALTQAEGQPLTPTSRWPLVIEHFTEYRYLDVTAALKATLELDDLWLRLQLDRPTPDLQLHAWLELKLRPRL